MKLNGQCSMVNVQLLGCFAEFAEMTDYFLVVKSRVDVEAVPEVAENNCAPETVVFEFGQSLGIYASSCHHLAVYQPLACGIVELLMRVGGFAIGFGDAVEDRREEHIIHPFTLFLKLFD